MHTRCAQHLGTIPVKLNARSCSSYEIADLALEFSFYVPRYHVNPRVFTYTCPGLLLALCLALLAVRRRCRRTCRREL